MATAPVGSRPTASLYCRRWNGDGDCWPRRRFNCSSGGRLRRIRRSDSDKSRRPATDNIRSAAGPPRRWPRGRTADDCAGNRTARSTRQHAAEYAARTAPPTAPPTASGPAGEVAAAEQCRRVAAVAHSRLPAAVPLPLAHRLPAHRMRPRTRPPGTANCGRKNTRHRPTTSSAASSDSRRDRHARAQAARSKWCGSTRGAWPPFRPSRTRTAGHGPGSAGTSLDAGASLPALDGRASPTATARRNRHNGTKAMKRFDVLCPIWCGELPIRGRTFTYRLPLSAELWPIRLRRLAAPPSTPPGHALEKAAQPYSGTNMQPYLGINMQPSLAMNIMP